jgi:alpha-1,2-mannosyltransferase
MQTWEYAPQYALRTYAYLLPMTALAKLYQFLLNNLPQCFVENLPKMLMLPLEPEIVVQELNKPIMFALLRSSLALISAYSELRFVSSIHDEIDPNLAYLTAFALLSSAGMFHAAAAYLPSSTGMILWMMSISHQIRGRDGWSILWGLLATLGVGWPFCAVLFVSTGCWAVWVAYFDDNEQQQRQRVETKDIGKKRGSKQAPIVRVMQVLLRTARQAAFIQTIITSIDYYYYGRVVSPIWNIFTYNTTGGGDELYGIEPPLYYIKNVGLNFNFAGFLGVVGALPLLMGRMLLSKQYNGDGAKILTLVPMYLWLAVVVPRPHKEERFLFPIYPMMCFGAAIVIDEILDAVPCIAEKCRSMKSGSKRTERKLLLGLLVLSPVAIISISRSLALHHNYTAPLALYRHLFNHISKSPPPNKDKYFVCTGGEWYR